MRRRRRKTGCVGCLSVLYGPLKLLTRCGVSVVRWSSKRLVTLPIRGRRGMRFSVLGLAGLALLVCLACAVTYWLVDVSLHRGGVLPTLVPTATPQPTPTIRPTTASKAMPTRTPRPARAPTEPTPSPTSGSQKKPHGLRRSRAVSYQVRGA